MISTTRGNSPMTHDAFGRIFRLTPLTCARAYARSTEKHVRMRHASRPPRRPDAGHLVRAACSHNGDSLSRRLLQENGCAGRRSRLKIQAGCRPTWHTLPDPNDVDALWSRNSTAGSAPSISAPSGFKWNQQFLHSRNLPIAKSDETDLRTLRANGWDDGATIKGKHDADRTQ